MLLMFFDFIAGISQIFEPNIYLALKMVTKIAVTLRGYFVLSCMIEPGMLSSLTALSSSLFCYCHYLMHCFKTYSLL